MARKDPFLKSMESAAAEQSNFEIAAGQLVRGLATFEKPQVNLV